LSSLRAQTQLRVAPRLRARLQRYVFLTAYLEADEKPGRFRLPVHELLHPPRSKRLAHADLQRFHHLCLNTLTRTVHFFSGNTCIHADNTGAYDSETGITLPSLLLLLPKSINFRTSTVSSGLTASLLRSPETITPWRFRYSFGQSPGSDSYLTSSATVHLLSPSGITLTWIR
jgi:hypothetical protein